MKTPNPKTHLILSFLKSFLRIAGCFLAIFVNHFGLIFLASFLITAEIIGVLEEIF